MMRLIKKFILRLYTDLELREQICGDLQLLPGRKTFPFKNKVELVDILVQLANEEVKDNPLDISPGENEPISPDSKPFSG
jgi:hypothetical protein